MRLNSPKFGSVIAAVVLAWAGAVPGAWAQANKPAGAPPPAAKPPASAPAPTPEALIEQLLVVSGYKHQVSVLPDQMVEALKVSAAQQKKPGPVDVAELEKIFRETIIPKGFEDRGAAVLKKNYDEPRMRAILEMISTPLAKRMTEFEKVTVNAQEFGAFTSALAGKPLPPARIELLVRLDTASRASEVAVEAMLTSIRAMAIGATRNDKKKIAELDRGIEKNRAAATAGMRDQVILGMAFTYRKATDGELAQYIQLLSSDNGKWFGGLLAGALIDEFKAVSGQVGERIASAAKAAKGGPKTASQAAPAATMATAAAGDAALGEPAPPLKRSRAKEDARHCLDLRTRTAIIKCAEQYQ